MLRIRTALMCTLIRARGKAARAARGCESTHWTRTRIERGMTFILFLLVDPVPAPVKFLILSVRLPTLLLCFKHRTDKIQNFTGTGTCKIFLDLSVRIFALFSAL
jgi:hypothetical protein